MAVDESRIAALIEQWAARQREARKRSRSEHVGDAQTAYYYRGVSDTCQQVIDELMALVDAESFQKEPSTADYLPVSHQEADALLARVGLYPRSLSQHSDHAFTATFSRLQPITQTQRLRLLAEADSRLVILDEGKLPDTNDPFIDFAFVDKP